ncbi:hypothetical protein GCM10009555_040340 [Acrocarpospora macrocephala]|uniref:Glycosyltransferase 2-like domain-containing protein n=1 Tax=Acrocarpospora macrocephala TaxID=150177 RepID=A0A5M3WTR5_9ACTN|nr:glycosyltransferase [Acrocarpospora macrocephala]GES09993.1 hypothetical protein Amac_035890 [Acrocarpospora macrocephala]
MTGRTAGRRPLIAHNDYSPLTPPVLGQWEPATSVSVIVPAHGGQHRLDLTLASLVAQSYPADLTEVVVVDDGSDPPLGLPEIRPQNTRLVRADGDGWGPAHAVNVGAAASEGTVIQRLDADMILYREHLEALMRWHHLTDYLVTIGSKQFVEDSGGAPAAVRDAVAQDRVEELFDLSHAVPSSTERTIQRLDGLRRSKNPYHVCTGPTLSLHRRLFQDAGGFDPEVIRGEDTEFAYRLAQAGSVFVPDPEARAVHLGLPSQRRNRSATVRAVEPFLAHRIPLRRDLRKERSRQWLVPYVEVVLNVEHVAERDGRRAVDAALSGTLPDVSVTLVAPWSKLPLGRHGVLSDSGFELRMLREGFAHDPRVRLTEEIPPSAAPIPFRYVGPVDLPLEPTSLERMTKRMTEDGLGLLVVTLPDGRTARMERTEAVSRALLLADPASSPAQVIAQTHGVRHSEAKTFWAGELPALPPAPQPEPPLRVRIFRRPSPR